MFVSGISFKRGILINIIFVFSKEEPYHDPGFHEAQKAVSYFSLIIMLSLLAAGCNY